MIGYADRILSLEQIRKIATHLMAALVVLTAYAMSAHNVSAANIYDARILQRMKFTGSQRAKVKRIIRQSDKEIAVVFRKYGINPMPSLYLKNCKEPAANCKPSSQERRGR